VHQSTTAARLPFAQLLIWLQLLGHDAKGSLAAFVVSLVQELIQQSIMFELPSKQSLQLYQLLLELQQQPAWQQQGLTGLAAGACDVLIQQHRQPAWYGTSASSVLQLLQHAAGDSNSGTAAEQGQLVPLEVHEKLGSNSQSVVLAALVRLAHHTDALQLVQQAPQGNEQLPALLQLWTAQLRQAQQAGAADATMSVSDDEGEPQQQWQKTHLASQVATRVRGSPVTQPVLQQALAVALQSSTQQQLQLSVQVVQLMQQAAPNSSVPDLFAAGQMEQYLLLLCKDSTSSSFATAAELEAACVDSSAPVQFSAAAVAAFASAAAAAGAGSASQQLLQMAELPVLVAAGMQLAKQQDAAPLQLLLSLVLGACSSGRMPADQVLQQLSDSDLQQLLSLLCRSAASQFLAPVFIPACRPVQAPQYGPGIKLRAVGVWHTGGYAAGMRIPAAYCAVWRAVSHTGHRPHGVITVSHTANRSHVYRTGCCYCRAANSWYVSTRDGWSMLLHSCGLPKPLPQQTWCALAQQLHALQWARWLVYRATPLIQCKVT
jgi:hypothetical protein